MCHGSDYTGTQAIGFAARVAWGLGGVGVWWLVRQTDLQLWVFFLFLPETPSKVVEVGVGRIGGERSDKVWRHQVRTAACATA